MDSDKVKDKLNKQKIELLLTTTKFMLFDYVGKDLKVTHNRKIIPLAFNFGNGKLIDTVSGFDLNSLGYKQFHIEGIQNLRLISIEDLNKY